MSSYRSVDSRTSSAVKGFFPGLTYVDHRSLLHRVHPLVKLVILFSFSLTAFALHSITGGIILFCLLLIFYGLAGLGLAFFSRKLRFILVFGFFIFFVQVLAVKKGALLWQLSLGPVCFSIWSEGFLGGLSMMLRFINIIGSSYLFVATTNPNRLAYAPDAGRAAVQVWFYAYYCFTLYSHFSPGTGTGEKCTDGQGD